jgi:serine/threonine-protein kinase
LRGVGSVPYTPLEQYGDLSDHTDVRSDIYALGATLYHLLTGSEPPSAQEIFLQPDALVMPREINPDISRATEGAILSAMGSHPADRPSTVEAWCRELRSGRERAAHTRPAARRRPAPESAWGQIWRENGWLLLLGLLLTALVLFLTFR